MGDILFQLMMVHGIHRLADSGKLSHHIHFPYEKSIIKRTVRYIKDRMKGFHDYFPCRKNKCKLQHIQKWFNLFVSHYNNNLFS